MKVVINALSARLGGGQTYLLNLLRYLDAAEGIEIYIYADDSLAVPDHPAIHPLSTGWPTENVAVRTLWERYRLPAILREMGADVLFCPGGLVNTPPPPGCKSVTMFRNMLPFDPAQTAKYGRYLRTRMLIQRRAMLRSMIEADLVIFISDFARGLIESVSGGRVKRAVTIPHGLDAHFRVGDHAPAERPSWLPAEDYLLYVSSLYAYKNQVEVVRGFGMFKEARGGSEKLVLAGPEDKTYADRVRHEISALGLEDEVTIAGSIPYRELPHVYQHAKLNLFASECENCPNIVIEALGAGRPLLVSDRNPMPEFAGEAGVYFDPSSPEDLAAKLRAVIDDEERQKELADLARQQSLRFSWKDTAERTWSAIRSLHERS